MENHYRLLVAEDEPRILRNIIKKIEEADPRFKIEGNAQDGEDALRLIGKLKPDILFTDIVMPKMDGLELIGKALQICPGLHIVILSGFSDFSYAQQAIQFGIDDYLLKPLKKDALVDVLNSISEKIDTKRKETARSDFYNLIHQGKSFNPKKIESTGNDLVLFLVCLGNFQVQPGEVPQSNKQNINRIWDKLEPERLFSEAFNQNGCWCINGKKVNQKYLILKMENQNIDKIHLYANKIKDLTSTSAVPFSVNVCYSKNLLSIGQLFSEARLLRRQLRNKIVPSISQVIEWKEKLFQIERLLHPDVEKKIGLLVEKGEGRKLIVVVRDLLFKWKKNQNTQFQIEKGMEHITRIIQISQLETEQAKVLDIIQRINLAFACNSDIDNVFYDFLNLIDSEFLKNLITRNPEGLANMLEAYLENHYTESISLELLSERFGYEPAYLTRLYKKYKGESPIKSLTRLRIKNACNLLKDHPEMDLKDIGIIIGYRDHHYFSRVFKKITGMSPSKYRHSF